LYINLAVVDKNEEKKEKYDLFVLEIRAIQGIIGGASIVHP